MEYWYIKWNYKLCWELWFHGVFMIVIESLRQQSVDSLNGRFFTRGFSAVGRSGKKKDPWAKKNNREKWPFPSYLKGLYLSVGLLEAKIWDFKIFPIFDQFFSHRSFFGSLVDPPFKESTDHGLMVDFVPFVTDTPTIQVGWISRFCAIHL